MAITVAQVQADIDAVRKSLEVIKRDIADIGSEQIDIADKIRALTAPGVVRTAAQEAEFAALRAKRAQLQTEMSAAEVQQQDYEQRLSGLQLDLRNAQAIEAAAAPPPPQPPAPQTAAQDAQAAAPPPTAPTAVPPQVAAPVTGQVTTPPPVTTPSNAVVPPTTDSGGGDSGTNAPTRSLTQTQATSNQFVNAQGQAIGIPLPAETGQQGTIQRNSEDGSLYDAGPLAAPTSPGVGAQDDAAASYGGATSAEQAAINAAIQDQGRVSGTVGTGPESQRIVPQGNVLDRFSSYTYRASWYLMTPEQYRQLVVSQKKQVNGYMLLMQSGGAPPNVGGAQGALSTNNQAIAADAAVGGLGAGVAATTIPGAGEADAGRNPFFPQDFYIDSINIENLLIGAGSRAAHTVSRLNFTVVEPANITLLDRLYEAVQDFMPSYGQSSINYSAVTYLMVIRFYGYDQNGNLVTNIGAPDATGKSDPNAVIEKFIPFKIAKCDFSVSGSLVTYSIEAKPPGLIIAAGTRRGTIPYDLQLTSKSLGDLLGDTVVFSTATAPNNAPGASTSAATGVGNPGEEAARQNAAQPAPANASAAPSPQSSLSQGLIGAMNQFQQDLVKNGTYEYADTYKLVFVAGGPGGGGQAIAKAKLIPPGTTVDKRNLATAAPPTVSANSADPAKVSANVNARNYAITAGMQLVQAIDMAIRNSDYIYKQQTKFFNEDRSDATADEQSQSGTGRDVTWYNITFDAVPKPGQYDRKRNDFAYDITFKINTYRPLNFASNFFPLNRFRGLHKKYNYWFTGQNSQVLEYKETLNNLYNLTISGSADQKNLAQRQQFTSSMRDQPFYSFQSASNESRQGAAGRENEPGANLAEYLYDPVGLADGRLRIVGDPAWIQQGSFSTGIDPANFQFNAFLPDGTINFDAQEILFEVAWQKPADYDLNTGLADPYAKTTRREPIQSRVYTAKKVVSEFNKGNFSQNLEGKLYFFMKPDASNKAATAPVPKAVSEPDNRAEDNSNDGSFDAVERARLARGAPTAGVAAIPDRVTAGLGIAAAATAAAPSLRGRLAEVAGAVGSAVRGALPAPVANLFGSGGGPSGQTNTVPPDPASTVQPAPPPVPATSSGTNVNINALPGADVAGLGFDVPPAVGRFTAQQLGVDAVEVDASGNRRIRITVTGVGNSSPNAPQNISRDP